MPIAVTGDYRPTQGGKWNTRELFVSTAGDGHWMQQDMTDWHAQHACDIFTKYEKKGHPFTVLEVTPEQVEERNKQNGW